MRTPRAPATEPTGATAPVAPAPRSLRIAIVAANTFEHDSRLLRTGRALAEDGHRVTLLAFASPGLPAHEQLGERLDLVRLDVDRRVTSAFRPLSAPTRASVR